MKKYFMWIATDAYGEEPMKAPYYASDVEKIGKKFYHSLNDILKMDISDSTKARLRNAAVGGRIKIHDLHANGDLYAVCIDQNNIPMIKKYHQNSIRISKLSDQIDRIKEANLYFEKLLKRRKR